MFLIQTTWQPEHFSLLEELVKAKELSAARIAVAINEKFSTTFTRNAVIGKCNRAGLSTGRAGVRVEPRTRSATPHVRRAPRVVIPFAEIADTGIPPEQRRTLVQLGSHDCRWPVGEPTSPEFFYCGGPVASRSYCAAHYHRAYYRRAA